MIILVPAIAFFIMYASALSMAGLRNKRFLCAAFLSIMTTVVAALFAFLAGWMPFGGYGDGSAGGHSIPIASSWLCVVLGLGLVGAVLVQKRSLAELIAIWCACLVLVGSFVYSCTAIGLVLVAFALPIWLKSFRAKAQPQGDSA